MSKLYTTETRYKTLETLEMFMDVSKHRAQQLNDGFARSKLNLPSDNHLLFETVLSRFSFGRMSGKTTAVVDYVKKNAFTKNHCTVIVTHNFHCKGMYEDLLTRGFLKSFNVHLTTISESMDKFRGLILGDVEIIFDECQMDHIRQWTHEFLVAMGPRNTITGMVSVGDM